MASEKEFSILIIEDHVEMRELMHSFLEPLYYTFQAEDGSKGFEIAKAEIPDLILTDVSMPNTDGLEFCQLLRKTMETSHIPVVMITAKSMEEDQLKGYQSGATDYIVKPFNVAILQLKIKNILDGLKKMRSRFSLEKNNYEEVTDNTFDSELMKRLMLFIETNFQDSTLSIDSIATELGLSKSTLYRKLKAITGSSAMDILQVYRLKRAYELLQKSDLNVSEIAYAVGYTDPGYFGSRFKEHYNISPSAISKRDS